MSDRIVVMRDGQFEQIGTPDEIYNRPKTSYVADFVGNANIISGVVERIDGELTDIRVNSRLITAKTVDGLKEGGSGGGEKGKYQSLPSVQKGPSGSDHR